LITENQDSRPGKQIAYSNDTRSLLKDALFISIHFKVDYAFSVWVENYITNSEIQAYSTCFIMTGFKNNE